MNRSAQQHLTKAKEYAERGDGFYEKAADEILAAKDADPALSNAEIARGLSRAPSWVSDVLKFASVPHAERASGPFSRDSKPVELNTTKRTLRETKPSDIAEDLLSDPQIRKTLQRAEDIRANRMVREAQQAERRALGDEASDALVHQQTLRNAEAELFKARRSIIQTLRLLDVAKLEIDDSWREEFLRTLDDIIEKAEIGRDLLVGDLHEELTELLAGEAS